MTIVDDEGHVWLEIERFDGQHEYIELTEHDPPYVIVISLDSGSGPP
jgi:hypothetical protein